MQVAELEGRLQTIREQYLELEIQAEQHGAFMSGSLWKKIESLDGVKQAYEAHQGESKRLLEEVGGILARSSCCQLGLNLRLGQVTRLRREKVELENALEQVSIHTETLRVISHCCPGVRGPDA